MKTYEIQANLTTKRFKEAEWRVIATVVAASKVEALKTYKASLYRDVDTVHYCDTPDLYSGHKLRAVCIS